jgi:hypothetical protein
MILQHNYMHYNHKVNEHCLSAIKIESATVTLTSGSYTPVP